jgi:hypothetical protein
MENWLPHRVPDVNSFTHVWNMLREYLIRITLHSSSDILVRSDTHGTTLILAKKPSNISIGGTSGFVGEWDSGRNYTAGQEVIIPFGLNSGNYFALIPSIGQPPYQGGGYWVQAPSSPLGVYI